MPGYNFYFDSAESLSNILNELDYILTFLLLSGNIAGCHLRVLRRPTTQRLKYLKHNVIYFFMQTLFFFFASKNHI